MFKFIILLFCLFIISCNLDEDSGNGKENLNICMDQIDFNSSLLQAFYIFHSVTLNGEAISSDDWVGAFNGDVCVGGRQWDTSNCLNGACDVPALGSDGQSFTLGYLMTGDMPTFKIYDSSEGKIYATNLMNESGEIIDAPTWENNDFNIIHSLVAIPETGMDCND